MAHQVLMAIFKSVSPLKSAIAAIEMTTMAFIGGRQWREWRSPLSTMAIGPCPLVINPLSPLSTMAKFARPTYTPAKNINAEPRKPF